MDFFPVSLVSHGVKVHRLTFKKRTRRLQIFSSTRSGEGATQKRRSSFPDRFKLTLVTRRDPLMLILDYLFSELLE